MPRIVSEKMHCSAQLGVAHHNNPTHHMNIQVWRRGWRSGDASQVAQPRYAPSGTADVAPIVSRIKGARFWLPGNRSSRKKLRSPLINIFSQNTTSFHDKSNIEAFVLNISKIEYALLKNKISVVTVSYILYFLISLHINLVHAKHPTLSITWITHQK